MFNDETLEELAEENIRVISRRDMSSRNLVFSTVYDTYDGNDT